MLCTLVPTMARLLLPDDHEDHLGHGGWGKLVRAFDRRFEGVKERYRLGLATFVGRRGLALACVAMLIVLSLGLLPIVGEDFFPVVDAGMMRLHVRAPTGTRIEHTEYLVDQIDRTIRTIIPAAELESISDNVGLPVSYDLAFYQTDSVGPQDADVLIQLKPKHRPTAMYEDRIRRDLAREFGRVSGQRVVLRHRTQSALLEQRQRLHQRQRPHLGEVLGQVAGGHVGVDRVWDLMEDGAAIHPGVELHDRHARPLEPVDDRPLDGGSAPQLRE